MAIKASNLVALSAAALLGLGLVSVFNVDKDDIKKAAETKAQMHRSKIDCAVDPDTCSKPTP